MPNSSLRSNDALANLDEIAHKRSLVFCRQLLQRLSFLNGNEIREEDTRHQGKEQTVELGERMMNLTGWLIFATELETDHAAESPETVIMCCFPYFVRKEKKIQKSEAGRWETWCMPTSSNTTMHGSVDYQSLKRLVEFQIDNGADFLCIAAPPL